MSSNADKAWNFKGDHESPPLLLQLCFLPCWTSSSAVTCHPHPQSSRAELQAGQMCSPPCWAIAWPHRDKHRKKDLFHHRKIISGHSILPHIRVYWNSDKAKSFLFVFAALCGEWNYSLQCYRLFFQPHLILINQMTFLQAPANPMHFPRFHSYCTLLQATVLSLLCILVSKKLGFFPFFFFICSGLSSFFKLPHAFR